MVQPVSNESGMELALCVLLDITTAACHTGEECIPSIVTVDDELKAGLQACLVQAS